MPLAQHPSAEDRLIHHEGCCGVNSPPLNLRVGTQLLRINIWDGNVLQLFISTRVASNQRQTGRSIASTNPPFHFRINYLASVKRCHDAQILQLSAASSTIIAARDGFDCTHVRGCPQHSRGEPMRQSRTRAPTIFHGDLYTAANESEVFHFISTQRFMDPRKDRNSCLA